MSRTFAHETSRRVRLIACLALLATLGACGSSHTHRSSAHYNPSRYYPPPGPANDPWGPYIHEASGRFGVPENWIRSVMRQESGGQEDVISWAGAMGLMQVMPDTYDGLRARYNLGDDPFNPHNNILAGTAYLREMYDRFGSPGFLAAYNAGPNRLDQYLSNGAPLPAETVNYVASVAPSLGSKSPMSGPLAVYAQGATVTRVAYRPTSAGCDPDAAYDPGRPCTPLRPVQTVEATPYAVAPTPYTSEGCDPDAAYDPTRPCQPPARASVNVQPIEPPAARPPLVQPPTTGQQPLRYAIEGRPIQERMAQPVAFAPVSSQGRWTIQVGAFATLSIAEATAKAAQSAAPDLLQTTKIELPATSPLGTQVAFRARLSGLSQAAAVEACSRLTRQGSACITVPPSRDTF